MLPTRNKTYREKIKSKENAHPTAKGVVDQNVYTYSELFTKIIDITW